MEAYGSVPFESKFPFRNFERKTRLTAKLIVSILMLTKSCVNA